jgi:hypothetical protein
LKKIADEQLVLVFEKHSVGWFGVSDLHAVRKSDAVARPTPNQDLARPAEKIRV